MENKIINKIDISINENALKSFNFESIITLEELLTYFFSEKIKLQKNNYISFFKIFKHYIINKSLEDIFINQNYYKNTFEVLFKLQFISIILDEIYSSSKKEESNIKMIKTCLKINHQNFLMLSFILIDILQLNNMTNLYQNKINKIIYEKLNDFKLYQNNNLMRIDELITKIKENNKDIENKIKLIINKKNHMLYNAYNKLNISNIEEFINLCLKILGLNENEINELNELNKELDNEDNTDIIKSVNVPFLSPIEKKDNYILTIVLDLDKTLIYCEDEEDENYEEEEDEEKEEEVKNEIILRPGLYEFLDSLMKLKCELIIFTSSKKQKADEYINKIEKNKKYFNKILYRDYCTLIGAAYVKDISKLGRDLSKTIIIDNDLGCFYLQQENGILIKSFNGEKDDKNLFNLLNILQKIIKSPFNDIRYELDKYKNEFIKYVTN